MRSGRSAVRLVLFTLALLGAARPAVAHTHLAGTTPAANDTVAAGLQEIRLRFTHPPEPTLTWLALLRGADTVASGTLSVVPGSQGHEFVLHLVRPLGGGQYRVSWRCAGEDGHVLRGVFGFTVRSDPRAAAPAPMAKPPVVAVPSEASGSATSPLAAAVRWGWFLALLGMIGAPVFYGGVLDRLRRRGLHEGVTARAAYGAWHVAAGAAALSLVTLVLRLWLQSADVYGAEAALQGSRLAALLQTTGWGRAWTLQAVATVGFFLGLMIVRAPHGRGVGWMGAGVAAVLLATVPALSGHASSVERASGLAIVTDALHVLSAGAWLGTLAVLMAAGIPAALSAADGGGPAALADLVNAFSPVALVGGGLAGLTGLGNALFHIGRVSDLWQAPYGEVLALKLLLLVGVAAAGAFNWRRLKPTLGSEGAAGRLRRSATLELGFAALVVAATAVLVALPTP